MGGYSIPFAPPNSFFRAGDSIADLMARRGDIAGEAARRSGDIWGKAISQVGQLAGQGVEQYAQQKQQQQIGETVTDLLHQANQDPNFDLGAAIKARGINPRLVQPILTAYDQANSAAANVQERIARMDQIHLAGQKARQEMFQSALDFGGTVGYHAASPEMAGDDGGLTALGHAIELTQARMKGNPELEQTTQSTLARIAPSLQQRMVTTRQAQASGDPSAIAKEVDTNKQFVGGVRDLMMQGMSPTAKEALVKEATAGETDVAPGHQIIKRNIPGLTGGGGQSGTSVISENPDTTKPLDVQLANAYRAGDTASQGRLIKAIHESAEAKKDPATIALVNANLEKIRTDNENRAQDKDALVTGLLKGSLSPQDMGRAQSRADILAEAVRRDPNFTTQTYQARKKMRDDYANSSPTSAGGQMDSLNQLAEHLQTLKALGDAQKNGNIKLVSTIVNKVKDEFGSPSVNNYETASLASAEEIARLMKGGVAAEGEGQAWLKRFTSSASDAQREGAVSTAQSLVHGRINSKRTRFETVMGKDNAADFDSYIGPAAKQLFSGKAEEGATPKANPFR